ncbi:hypothetical protein PIB30_091765 [Stylosanthes scabra]|uniref:Retrotransposon Copia-like N-terminal domain-containing protein n=1 Tax=Stylosanthes scabra TaxID=79078 RepID=A0ABU6ZTC9_9FABA|nr:hypothetical protein [Stylosanthes scabra]
MITSAHFILKNNPIPLAEKLDEKNFSMWKKSVLLTLRTLKLQDHLYSDKIPPQFKEISTLEAESESTNKNGDAEGESIITTKKTTSSAPKILQELEKFGE